MKLMGQSWQDFENSPECVVEVAVDGKILRANASFCRLLGYSHEELLSLYVRDLTHPEDRAQSVSIVDWALSHQDQPLEVIKRYLRRDGKVLWCLLRTTLRRNPQGQPETFLSFLDDFSDRLEREPMLKALAHRVEMQAEHERLRISRELHTEIGQMLTALKQELAWLKEQVPPGSERRAARISLVVEEIASSITRMWMGLRPFILDELGLIPALDWLLQETCGRADIAYQLDTPQHFARLDSDTRIGLFRIAQEALSNVVHHSGASLCRVQLQQDEAGTWLDIYDNGRGLSAPDLPSQGPGLLAMRERARLLEGRLELLPGNPGTLVRVVIPSIPKAESPHKVPPSWG